jgi:Rps23 Pro-64 3,4-dihydroxylase Tpa1-like proline 4-hydroxylase
MINKADKNYNFIYFKEFNIELIKEKCIALKEEWLLDQSRQNMQYPERRNPHLYTNTYIVQDHHLFWQNGEKFLPTLKDPEIYELVMPIIKELQERICGKAARVLLIKLEGNKNVTEHTDSGDYLNTVRRFHIPIITNDKVYYTVNGEKIHMKAGECWEINNRKPHSVDNDSDEERIHLLIDIMPESEFRTYDSLLPESKIKVIENFISEEDAQSFIDYINNNYLNNYKFTIGKKALAAGNLRYQSNVPEEFALSDHEEMSDLIKKYSDKFLNECYNFFKDDFELYLTAFWMTRFEKNTKLPFHNDNHEGAEHLFRSGVIYLNDDYDGGYLKFLDHSLTYKPKRLSLVIFDSEYMHEITNIVSGARMALPIWATKNPKKCIL